MDESLLYWFWLGALSGLNTKRANMLIEAFGGPFEVWQAKDSDIKALEFMNPQSVDQVMNATVRNNVGEKLNAIQEQGIEVVSIASSMYPEALKHIYDPPLVLFKRGTSNVDMNKTIAIVGTRHPTHYGLSVTQKLTRELIAFGYTVVSGMAMGIDAIAHTQAIASNGKTIAVLGSGIDKPYPASNRKLMTEIMDHGIVFSEFLPGTPPLQQNFPKRNRIISGISMAVLVIEAGKQSGSLITAGFAGEQGRDVFAVPGSIYSPMSVGTNHLIRDGAIVATSVEDILESLNPFLLERELNEIPNQHEVPMGEEERCIVALLKREGPMDMNAILKNCGLSHGTAASTLVSLELRGILNLMPGTIYQLADRIIT